MTNGVVLGTTAQLQPQVVQDTLAGREAMEIVSDWLGEYFKTAANIRSWTPYWKEMILRQPGNLILGLRFRLGGPVEISQSHGWDLTAAERDELERALLPLLDELGRALTQRRAADAIQSQYADTTRKVRDDNTIVLQFKAPITTAPLGSGPIPPAEMAVIVRPDQTLQVFARTTNEELGRAAIRRFLANLQVAGLPLEGNTPISRRG